MPGVREDGTSRYFVPRRFSMYHPGPRRGAVAQLLCGLPALSWVFDPALQIRTDGRQRVYRVCALEFEGARLFTDVGAFGSRFVPGQSTLGAGSWA